MPTSAVEDYLKTILVHEQEIDRDTVTPEGLVTMGQIATSLEVAPGTVTSMVKTLEKSGLLRYEPYSGVRLTDSGRQLALHVLRRHRLIELFLVEVLELDWSEVHDEAERLEHAMSDKLVDRVDALLGYPSVDPHGDPIPDFQGKLRQSELIPLAECPEREGFRVARVSDQEESFLRFVEREGLKPGTHITVLRRDLVADTVMIRAAGGREVILGGEAAAKLWVEPARFGRP